MPITKPCENCGVAVTRPPSHFRNRTFCSSICRNKGITKTKVNVRRQLVLPEHPLAPPSGLIGEHRVKLYDRIGPGPHPCHWCEVMVNWKPGAGPRRGVLVVDHLDNDWSNNARENLVPSCPGCNGTRTQRVKDDEVFVETSRGRKRAELRTCRTCGGEFGYARSPSMDAKGGGTYCSRECLWSRPR